MNEIILNQGNKLIIEETVDSPVFDKEKNSYVLKPKKVLKEKVLEITYFNGLSYEKAIVKNLNQRINGETKEQRLNHTILVEKNGHILLEDSGGLIIKVTSIMSMKPKYIPLE